MWYLGLGVRYKLCLMVLKYYITPILPIIGWIIPRIETG